MMFSGQRLTTAILSLALILGSVGVARANELERSPSGAAAAPGRVESGGDLTELSLEDLMSIEIISVSKKAEKLGDSAAAIYVITNEDLRRSGATSIAEALRMVPGLDVAQISANRWAISSRGFSSEFANKLLVLMDGRSVYTPLFSGVFWDVQDTLLADVDRIEVIRGPGATLWGANAVNGVINIITKSASETQGGLLTGGMGTHERGFGSFRWGGGIGDSADYRVYGKYFDRKHFDDSDGDNAHDEWDLGRGGFRLDWKATDDDLITFQGDYYRGDVGERHNIVTSLVPPLQPTFDDDGDVEGWNVLGRWTRSFSEESEGSLQAYFDRTERDIGFASEVRDTVDLDFQHRFPLGRRHDIVWGVGYRSSRDRTDGSVSLRFDPDDRRDDLYQGFVQDEIQLIEDRLRLTLGSKFEHNDYTGFEYQPSGRLLWKPSNQHTLWTAVSRAVRTPSRADDDVIINQEAMSQTFADTFAVVVPTGFPPPFDTTTVQVPVTLPFSSAVQLRGDRDFKSERLMAFEAGYRFTPEPRFSLDAALFFNEYSDLRSTEILGTDSSAIEGIVPDAVTAALLGAPAPFLAQPGALTTLVLDNRLDGHAYGLELASHWDVTDWWRISANYSWIHLNLQPKSNSTDPNTEKTNEGSTPTHQFHIRSFVDLPGDFEFDTLLYYVDNLAAQDVGSYVRLDARVGWQPREDLTLSVVFQNLLDGSHAEFGNTFFWPRSEIPRGVYGTVQWRF
jgi:iron complex outermembrane receptor protein